MAKLAAAYTLGLYLQTLEILQWPELSASLKEGAQADFWDMMAASVRVRVGNEISFRKNSAEQTRNGFHFTAEESPHSEAFRGYVRVNSKARNGTEFDMKKLVKKILLQQTEWTHVFSSETCIGMEFREFASIFVSRNGIPSWFLFRGLVWNRIPSVCFQFCSTERNSELFSLQRNGSERNFESLLLFLFHSTEFIEFFSSSERFRTEFREFSVPRKSRDSAGTNHLFRLFWLPRNNFFVGKKNCQPQSETVASSPGKNVLIGSAISISTETSACFHF